MTKPAFRIEVDGDDVTAQIKDRLVSLRVTDEAGQVSDSCEISLDDREKRVPMPRAGAWVRVWIGYEVEGISSQIYMGAFAVDEVELSCGPRSMVIRATAAATAPELNKEQRTQAWHQTTLGQVVVEVAERNGMQPVIKGDAGSTEIKHEDQTNESDQSFLTRLAEKHRVTIKPADGKLVMVPRGQGLPQSVPANLTRATVGQAMTLAKGAGFNEGDAAIMGAIAMAESSGDVRAFNSKPPDLSYGLWQINMLGRLGPARRAELGLSTNEELFNPTTNARAARQIFLQQGFKAWATYTSGAYKAYLGATTAGEPVTQSIVDKIFRKETVQAYSIKESDVTSWRANIKSRGAYGEVEVRYLDRETQTEKLTQAGEKGKLPTYQEKQLARNEEEAQKQAESRLQSLQSGEVRISLTMPGRPELIAEGLITLIDFRPEVDGTWNVKQVEHVLDTSGYRTSVEAGTQGDENNDWSRGDAGGGNGSVGAPGVNNDKTTNEKADLIARSAEQLRGMNTRGGPDGGNNACLFAVNRVLRNAGITPPWGNSNYVPTAQQVLAGGAGTLLSGPEPGAIAIMRDYGNPPYPHVGVVGTDGSTIISNSSSRGTFSWAAGEGSYTSTYGRTPLYYRLR